MCVCNKFNAGQANLIDDPEQNETSCILGSCHSKLGSIIHEWNIKECSAWYSQNFALVPQNYTKSNQEEQMKGTKKTSRTDENYATVEDLI